MIWLHYDFTASEIIKIAWLPYQCIVPLSIMADGDANYTTSEQIRLVFVVLIPVITSCGVNN